MDSLFENVGGKIKILAKVMFVIEIIGAVIYGFALVSDTEGVSLVYALISPVVAWISSCFIYGFGEIVDRACRIDENLAEEKRKAKVSNHTIEADELPDL